MELRIAHGAALSAALVALLAASCYRPMPPPRPEATCMRACEARATRCSTNECWRGCNLALDRIIEREGARVIACVAAEPHGKCDDPVWAYCTVRIGAHLDGGPPAPPPAGEYEAEELPGKADAGAGDDDLSL